jgi:hypothetical protein
MRLLLASGAALAAASLAPAQVVLTPRATIDVSQTAQPGLSQIGSNPTGVAWNGTDFWICGLNSSGAVGPAAIVPVTNALTAPSIGVAFATLTPPNQRGYSGLDISGNTLVAAYDAGTSDPNGIQGFDLTGNRLWGKAGRGGSGVGIDPGFNGNPTGSGTGWTTFGSGRRALQDNLTGADIYTTANGMVILTSQGSFWRDMDFDDATGDIWLREGNNVIYGQRTGDNAVTMSVVVDVTDADSVIGQNIAFCRTPNGNFAIYNDRPNAASGQDFFNVVKLIRPDGSALTATFGGFTPALGAGLYDFSFDPASQTLAILDFSNRSVTIFDVFYEPWFQYGSGCPDTGNIIPVLDMSGDPSPGFGVLNLDITQAYGGGFCYIFFGVAQAQIPLNPPCDLLLVPLPGLVGPLPINGNGPGTGTLTISGTLPIESRGGVLTSQAFILGGGTPGIFVTTNGVQINIPF